ncbi:MAG: YoeB toxin protein [uncultured Gemmatimonadetes bacterium]|uniref:Putative mRNA interferase YoeB n=1 Tax=uncultured Gemmatimonadota bacterium TaxID=203437 RepID=A0A6J4MAS5_9BACT|nr:MAG: YoeB toxin protein [uncultured Gemmatimonadota bacterium]
MLDEFRDDLAFWIGTQPRTALRIMRLVEEILRNPYTGTGKPEPLKHEGKGRWSRRITDEHRLVYYLTSVGTFFSEARNHYSR